MAGIHRSVRVELVEAELLADLRGVMVDLEAAAELCARAIKFGESREPDHVVIGGLVAAAVVRYIRCFGTGVRWGLRREDILELGERELSAHDYFKDLRDKFVVHSVNPFEDTFVTAVASEWDGVRHPITSLGWAQNRRALSPDIAFVLARLAAGVRAVIQKWVAVEERRLLAVIQALPLDTIHNGDLNSPRLIKDSDVSKSRKQKTRSRPPRKRRAAAK